MLPQSKVTMSLLLLLVRPFLLEPVIQAPSSGVVGAAFVTKISGVELLPEQEGGGPIAVSVEILVLAEKLLFASMGSFVLMFVGVTLRFPSSLRSWWLLH